MRKGALALKRDMFFNFGSYATKGKGLICYVDLIYKPCVCHKFYQFKPDSILPQYIKDNCKGWVDSFNNKYTLNYILFNLVFHWKSQGLVYQSGKLFLTGEIKSLIDPHRPRTECFIDLYFLRCAVTRLHLIGDYEVEELTLFLCCPESRILILDRLKIDCFDPFIFRDKCREGQGNEHSEN